MPETQLVAAEPAALIPKESFFDLTPDLQVQKAVAVAEILSKVIRDKKLSRTFGGESEYALVEAWQLCGVMLGLTARQRGRPVLLPDGSWEAEVELYHAATDRVIAFASAVCGPDEATWKRASSNARRSMAMTRAEGKTYRMNLAWILKMAGFEPTPAEEMPQFQHPSQNPEVYTGTQKQQRLVAGILEQQKLDESLWDKVGKHMMKKPITQTSLKEAIALTIAEAGTT